MATKQERDAKVQEIFDDYDITEEHREALRDALAGEGLRATNKQLSEQLNEYKDKAAKWDGLQKEKDAETKLRDKNVDWDSLRPLERSQLATALDGLDTDEKLEAFIADNDLPVLEAGEGGEEAPEAGNVRQFSREGRGSTPRTNKIDAEVMSKWSAEKIARFKEKHAEEHEQVMKGEEVHLAF